MGLFFWSSEIWFVGLQNWEAQLRFEMTLLLNWLRLEKIDVDQEGDSNQYRKKA